MKEEILKRAMFAMPLSKEAQNSGIMSGFDMEDMEGDVDENADMEEMPPMARTPQNPEILMNTLRGDMRSVDARYMELAQMVGEEAAMETPPEVLAMLMGQMGAQQGGIGALPQGQEMMPPGAQAPGAQAPGAGMPAPDQMGAPQPAPAMPQGGIPMPQGMESAPPFSQGAEAPQGFAYGGEVAPRGFAYGGMAQGSPDIRGNGAITGSGTLNMQVPISVGGGAGAGGGAGGQQANIQGQMAAMGGTADNGYMTFPGANNQGPGGGAGLFSGGFGMPNGIDPRAVEADPQGFQRWQQMAQEQERARPGSTMMSGPNSPQFGQQPGAGIARTMQGPPGMITNRNAFFAEGGEVAPPTPDGMPPMYAAAGAFINPAMRAAQFVGDKASQYGSAANAALGRMFMTPQGISQPYLENVRGPGGRFMAEQVQRGGDLLQPTFTQGLQQGVTRLAEQYPRAAQMALPVAGALGLAAAPKGGAPGSGGSSLMDQIPRDTREELAAAGQRPIDVRMDMNTMTQQRPGQPATPIPMARPPVEPSVATATAVEASTEAPATDDLGAFITDKLSAFDKRQKGTDVAGAIKEATKEKSKVDRIREARAEYEPLFKEILGDDKESAKINALLLLSEAGLKLASTRKPTFAMALADAASGLPRGFAAIAAQERELGVKGKMAALQQAIGDVDAQDKYAQALKLQVLKGDYELLKEQAKKGGQITKDGGAGLRVVETKDGSFVGAGIVPDDPTVKSAVQSRFTLRDTDNPFVENRGAAPTSIETDKSERVKLTNTLRSLDNSLSTLDNLKNVYTSAYGPGAWFSDKVNNLLVPVDPTGLVKPNFNVADASTRISTGMNSILKNIASANDSGRVAVQEQEWVRETAKGISDPTKFFADKELAAKQFGSMEAMLRNSRQQVLTQLGYEGNDYVMNTPNTGTKNDPFNIPADPAQQKAMFTFLGSTIGKLQDPRAVVHVRMPNGTVQQFNPSQLRALNQ